jgi:hypothetical protein
MSINEAIRKLDITADLVYNGFISGSPSPFRRRGVPHPGRGSAIDAGSDVGAWPPRKGGEDEHPQPLSHRPGDQRDRLDERPPRH